MGIGEVFMFKFCPNDDYRLSNVIDGMGIRSCMRICLIAFTSSLEMARPLGKFTHKNLSLFAGS